MSAQQLEAVSRLRNSDRLFVICQGALLQEAKSLLLLKFEVFKMSALLPSDLKKEEMKILSHFLFDHLETRGKSLINAF